MIEIRKDSKGNVFSVRNLEFKFQKDGKLIIKYEYAGDKDASISYVKSYIEKIAKDTTRSIIMTRECPELLEKLK